MKTAMQELIDELKLIEAYPMSPLVLRIATDLLEKEKEQIINAHGTKFNVDFTDTGDYIEAKITGEQYYNQTYNQNK